MIPRDNWVAAGYGVARLSLAYTRQQPDRLARRLAYTPYSANASPANPYIATSMVAMIRESLSLSLLILACASLKPSRPTRRDPTRRHASMALDLSPTASYVSASCLNPARVLTRDPCVRPDLPPCRWDTIQNVFYRKDEVYAMSWRIPDLSDYLIAGAKHGGPIGASMRWVRTRDDALWIAGSLQSTKIWSRRAELTRLVALMRDERKIMLLGKHSSGKPKIQVYTSSGIPIATCAVGQPSTSFTSYPILTILTDVQWELSPPILIHFTGSHLMVLSDEGTYRLYDLSNPSQYTQYTLGAEVAEMGIVSAKAYDDGFVVLTGGLQFLEVRGWRGGRVSALAPSGECGVWCVALTIPDTGERYDDWAELVQSSRSRLTLGRSSPLISPRAVTSSSCSPPARLS